MPPIRTVLVANRGEIALSRAAHGACHGSAERRGFSDADAGAPHVQDADEAVRIGPPPSRESYLAIDRLLEAARVTGADAVHPGYGFLAENAEVAERCAAAGLTFVGPPPGAIRAMGQDRSESASWRKAGVPVIPGVSGCGAHDEALAREVRHRVPDVGEGVGRRRREGHARGARRGQPAQCAGGGAARGAQRLRRRHAAGRALRESAAAVEIQVFGDAHGRVVHLFERECSIQRRYQKVVEEAPSPGMQPDLRARMGAAAVAAAQAIGYVGAGTVEFVLAPDGQFYFLEVNTACRSSIR